MFRRKIEKVLNDFYESKEDGRALIVYGARQIDKSFIIREKAKKDMNIILRLI